MRLPDLFITDKNDTFHMDTHTYSSFRLMARAIQRDIYGNVVVLQQVVPAISAKFVVSGAHSGMEVVGVGGGQHSTGAEPECHHKALLRPGSNGAERCDVQGEMVDANVAMRASQSTHVHFLPCVRLASHPWG